MPILDRCKALFQAARQGETRLPSHSAIPQSNVDEPERLGPPLEAEKHYFQVRVNEMYLAHQRQWFTEYDPMVFVGAEFIYGKAETAVPVVAGPSLLERFGKKNEVPGGTIFADTRVAGLHPYRGGRLAVTVILYRVQRVNYAQQLLKVIDSTAGALDFSTAVGVYVRVAGAVLDGVEALLGLGSADPIVGYRRELDPDAGDSMTCGYYALIDAPDVQPDQLWIRGGRLLHGSSAEKAKPFRSADYILYSLTSSPKRGDVRTLPFYPVWERALEEAAVATEPGWTSAKANMVSLYQSMKLSPDLTKPHVEELINGYKAELKSTHDRAVGIADLGPAAKAKKGGARAVSNSTRIQSIELLTM